MSVSLKKLSERSLRGIIISILKVNFWTLAINIIRAKASSPCIIFFDELDALCPKRDAKENQVSARVVNQVQLY